MTQSRPNIIWLTLESVRADHTSLQEYERDTTPNLERIATDDEGSSFSNCFAHSMWTPASTASILTGTYMSYHRIGMDGDGMTRLPRRLQTFPELLREQGYETACYSPNVYLSEANGLDRGFDHFARPSKHPKNARTTGLRPLLKYVLNAQQYGPGFSRNYRKHNLSLILVEMLKSRLDSFRQSSNPFFLYTHIQNPHYPYTPPNKWLDEYRDSFKMNGEAAVDRSLEVFGDQDSILQNIVEGCEFTDDEWDAFHALYDAEISYADECVGRLFDYVQDLNLENTIFVITGDHGELFGEHGLLGHRLVLDDAVTNVPLVIHGLDGVNGHNDDLVQHIDVTKTLAALGGCPVNQFQGYDIRDEQREYCLLQRGEVNFEEYYEHDPEYDTSQFHREPLHCLRTEDFRLQNSDDATRLFKLPDETDDVADSYPETLAELEARLDDLLAEIGSPDDEVEQAEFTEEMRDHLADMGYI